MSNGSYLMLHSWKVTVFTVFELLGKKQQRKAFLNKAELRRDVKFIYPKNIFYENSFCCAANKLFLSFDVGVF